MPTNINESGSKTPQPSTIDKDSLKKIKLDFDAYKGILFNSHPGDLYNNIDRFITFVQKTKFLIDYIRGKPKTGYDMNQVISEILGSFGTRYFTFGITNDEIIVNTYYFLTCRSFNPQTINDICFCYSFGCANNITVMVDTFKERVLRPFVSLLENYINKTCIDLGVDTMNQTSVTVNGGQFNWSQDNSTLNAVQNYNGVDFEQIQKMIEGILSVANEQNMPKDSMQQLSESLELVKEELQKKSPKKTAVRLIIDGLLSTSNILATIPIITAKINDFAQYIAPLLN